MRAEQPERFHEGVEASLLTPPGRGAVASIVVEGETAAQAVSQFFRPASGRPLPQAPQNRIIFGRWSNSEGAGEEVVLSRRTERRIEVHCHGGRLAPERILEDLVRLGCR